MKILTYYTIQMLEENQFAHTVHFEFMGKDFIAYVIENQELTYIERCYDFQDGDIDIPTYFGTGFSDDIFTMILNKVKSNQEKNKTQKEII